MLAQDVSARARSDAQSPLRRDSLQQQIYERLRLGILTGKYLPGESVSSRGLAQALDVSAMPVREALTRLLAEGALEMTSSRTLRLRMLSVDDFDEITAIRCNLEGMAAERGAAETTASEIAAVRRLHEDLATAVAQPDLDRFLAANAAFHAGIYETAHWPFLLGMIERLWLVVGPLIRASIPNRLHMATTMQFHDAALRALEARDARALRDAVEGDIRTAAVDIRAALSETSGAAG